MHCVCLYVYVCVCLNVQYVSLTVCMTMRVLPLHMQQAKACDSSRVCAEERGGWSQGPGGSEHALGHEVSGREGRRDRGLDVVCVDELKQYPQCVRCCVCAYFTWVNR